MKAEDFGRVTELLRVYENLQLDLAEFKKNKGLYVSNLVIETGVLPVRLTLSGNKFEERYSLDFEPFASKVIEDLYDHLKEQQDQIASELKALGVEL